MSRLTRRATFRRPKLVAFIMLALATTASAFSALSEVGLFPRSTTVAPAAAAASAPVGAAAVNSSYHPEPLPLALLEAAEQAKLIGIDDFAGPIDGRSGDKLGHSVAISGDTAAIGAPNDNTPGNDDGSVYVFVRDGASWTLQQKLRPAGSSGSTAFGVSVAIDGDTLLVGAWREDITGRGFDVGAAYVFVRNGTTWSQQAKLTAGDGAGGDLFGISVGLDGDTAVVGAYGDNTTAGTDFGGAAYVFVRSGTMWTEQQKLIAGDESAFKSFGWSVAVDGDTVAVGARDEDTNKGTDVGSAYVFARDGAAWSEQQKLTASDRGSGDEFGHSIDISGDTILVGAHQDDLGSLTNAGSAYVFVRSGTVWTEQQKLIARETTNHFGASVAIDGDNALVGADRDTTSVALQTGSAHLFSRSGAAWSQEQIILAGDASANDFFGTSVGLDGNTAVVGSPFDDAPVGESGSAYVFLLNLTDATPPVITPNVNGTLGSNDWYVSDVTVSWDTSDAESSVDSTSGCDEVTVTTDTAGVGFTCTATSEGGTSTETISIKRDATAPNVSASRAPAANAFGWNNTDVTATSSASDDLSGLSSPASEAFVFDVEGEGQAHTFIATDQAGNTASTTIFDVHIDKTRPHLFYSLNALPNINGWHNADVTVEVGADDALSGIDPSIALPVTHTLTEEGASVPYTFPEIRDRAGNVNIEFGWSVGTLHFKIDKTKPRMTGGTRTPELPNEYGWNNTDVSYNFTVTDDLSGLDPASPSSLAHTFNAEGAGQSHAFPETKDLAGNVLEIGVAAVNIDKTPPVPSYTQSTYPNANGWFNANLTLDYSATDALSGLDPGTPATGSHTFTEEGPNAKIIFKVVKDLAGNQISLGAEAGIFKIDKTAPTLSYSRSVEPNVNGWNNTDVTVSYSASDGVSGLHAGSPATGSYTFTIEGADQSYGFPAIKDLAGNTTNPAINGINIDKTPPIPSKKFLPAANANGWHNTNVTVEFTAIDAISGIDTSPNAIAGIDTSPNAIAGIDTSPTLTATHIIIAEGANQARTFGVMRDLAGNAVTLDMPAGAVKIDKTAPVLNLSDDRAPNANGWFNANVMTTYMASDALSGLDAASPPAGSHTFNTEGTLSHQFVAMDMAGNRTQMTRTVKVDKSPPVISCAVPDGLWHAADVQIPCTASDSVSGLDSPSDAGFALKTNVSAGTETADAATDSRMVTDMAGNTAASGNIGGNRVDKKAPAIQIASPANATYLLNIGAQANYGCVDAGSGVGMCAGPVPNGGPINTASLGMKLFEVKASDAVGNTSTIMVNYAVTYKVVALYDENKAHKSGSVVQFKIQLADANNVQMSSASILLTALGTSRLSSFAPGPVEEGGAVDPDDNFKFVPNIGGAGGYAYKMKTSGLATGTYVLVFKVVGDPVTHGAIFQIK